MAQYGVIGQPHAQRTGRVAANFRATGRVGGISNNPAQVQAFVNAQAAQARLGFNLSRVLIRAKPKHKPLTKGERSRLLRGLLHFRQV